MTERQTQEAQAIADRVLEFAEEVEASGQSVVGGDAWKLRAQRCTNGSMV